MQREEQGQRGRGMDGFYRKMLFGDGECDQVPVMMDPSLVPKEECEPTTSKAVEACEEVEVAKTEVRRERSRSREQEP